MTAKVKSEKEFIFRAQKSFINKYLLRAGDDPLLVWLNMIPMYALFHRVSL